MDVHETRIKSTAITADDTVRPKTDARQEIKDEPGWATSRAEGGSRDERRKREDKNVIEYTKDNMW